MKNKLWGIFLIILGLIFGLNALEITSIDIFFEGWWTLFIIVPCFIGIFTEEEKIGNMIGLLIGIALLLSCRDIIEFEYIAKLIFPAILIIIGLSIIFKDTISKGIANEIKKLNKDSKNKDEYCSTFSGQTINIDDKFTGCDLTAVFGGLELDLTKAEIKKDVVINASSIFGGIDILVPSNVKVKVKSTSIFGGIDNKCKNNEGVVIYVNGFCLFGGVEIKWQKHKK